MEGSGSREFEAGWRLSIRTTLGDDLDGQVLTFDKTTNVLVLHLAQEFGQTGPRRNLRFLKTNFIKDFTLLSQAEDPFDPKDSYIDINILKAREEAAIRQAEQEAERIGIGVTKEAQDIFDSLSRTLPVRWDKTVIVVMSDVRVSNPYLPENVTGGPPVANERVKKVLELERKRLQARGMV